MIGVSTSVDTDKDSARAVRQGVRETLREASDAGFALSQQRVPHGADSFLAGSGFEPRELEDGTWRWGYSARYARPVEDGARPHWIPLRAMPELKKWARRVLGDESAAWAVRQKIAEEGTDPQPFVGPGVQAQIAHLKARGISAQISKQL